MIDNNLEILKRSENILYLHDTNAPTLAQLLAGGINTKDAEMYGQICAINLFSLHDVFEYNNNESLLDIVIS